MYAIFSLDQNFSFNTFSLDLTSNTYWDTACTYVDVGWAWRTQIWSIFGLVDSNTNVFESFRDLFEIFTSTCALTSLSDIHDLVLENTSQVLPYTVSTVMWFIVRPPHWLGHWDLCSEGEDKIIWGVNVVRQKIVRFPRGHTLLLPQLYFGFVCSFVAPSLERIHGVEPCILLLIASRSELVLDMGSLIGALLGICVGTPLSL